MAGRQLSLIMKGSFGLPSKEQERPGGLNPWGICTGWDVTLNVGRDPDLWAAVPTAPFVP